MATIDEDHRPATSRQADRFTPGGIVLVIACVLCAILDGYDVVVISFVVPELSRSWNEPLASFGVVFSIGLAGLVAGSLGLAPLADQYGRRVVMLGALALGALATFANAMAGDVVQLIACRFAVGIAMGVIIALVVTIAYEASPPKHRVLVVTIVGCGLSLGNLASGLIASQVLPRFGWQPLFFGAAAINIGIALLFYLTLRDGPAAPQTERPGYLRKIGSLFSRKLAPLTLVLWLLHFGGVGANYMLISWLPSLLTRSGYASADAAMATSLISFGGLFGGLVSGFGLKWLGRNWLILLYGIAVVLISTLTFVVGTPLLYIANLFIGFCIVGGYISNSVVTSQLYPEDTRASGLGWAQGVGRTGSIFTPLLVSMALHWDVALDRIFLLAAAFPLLSTGATILLRRVAPENRPGKAEAESA